MNNNNKYDDFFNNQSSGERQSNDNEQTNEQNEHQDQQSIQQPRVADDNPAYYYSYGNGRNTNSTNYQSHQPVMTPMNNMINDKPVNPNDTNYTNSNTHTTNIPPVYQMTPSPVGGTNRFASAPAKEKKKGGGGFGKMFLSFMAGALVIGLLMFTADVNNWFTGKGNVQAVQGGKTTAPTPAKTNGSTVSTGTAGARPDNIAQLFETASPAVVKIETYTKVNMSRRGSSLLDDPFFRQFFGNSIPGLENNAPSQEGEMQQSGIGTGFFFDETGYILTNQHVIGESDEIKVTVEGYDKPFTATLLGSSYELDLAVLKIEGEEPFPTLSLGSSDDIQIGDWVIAIGNPYGFDHTITVGVLSAKERPINISDSEGTRNYENLLQTDASINPGNSGGPLLNVNGEVIGINTAVSSEAQGIGFAIPTSTINEVLDALKNNEKVPDKPSPFIGAELQDLTEEIAKELQLSSTEGTIVRSVYYNSPAYLGGLKQFDVIIGANDENIKTMKDLIEYISKQEVGSTIDLKIIRQGQEMILPIEIGDKNVFGLK